MSHPKLIKPFPQYLWFLTTSYTVVIVLANWFDARIVHLGWLNTDAGTLIFPLTYLLSDLITEVYGYKHARRAIWTGFLFNAIFILYSQLIVHLPNPPYPTQNAFFDHIISFDIRIIIASTISYLIAEPFNSYLMAKLKLKMHGHQMALRFVVSTLLASGIDSAIFGYIGFYTVLTSHVLFIFIFSMWLIKVIIEIVCLPFSLYCAKKLKRAEKLDIFDKNTRFTIFSLSGNYSSSNNLYQ